MTNWYFPWAVFGEPWLQAVREATTQAALTTMEKDTQLNMGTLGFKACVLGASASMLLDDYSLLFTHHRK